MATIIRKRKHKKYYYYVAVSKRVDGKPRIVSQTYLGTAERIQSLFQQKAAPVPLEATARDLGLPGALWLAATRSGAFDALHSLWPAPRKGPSLAHFLLLAAFHRICCPGPKTRVAAWYSRTVLPQLWGFPPKAFTSQAFWDRFDSLQVDPALDLPPQDDLEQAQRALLTAFRSHNLVSQRILSYDTTNFHTWIASTNSRCQLARRGHSKQKRHDLRQVGLSYTLDARCGLSLCHHVYPGNLADSDAMPQALQRLVRMLDHAGIERDSVTLVMDKGPAALANTLELQRHGLHWITALPWNQAPPPLREQPLQELPLLGPAHPGVRALARKELVQGAKRLCVVSHSAVFASEQMNSAMRSLARASQALRRIARELAQPQRKYAERPLRRRIERWLAPNRVSQVLNYDLTRAGEDWRLNFELDYQALQGLNAQRFGRTTLVTSREGWSAEEVVRAYTGQQQVEQVFRGMKQGGWVGWGPMHHWTDSKIRVHAFYCLLGLSLLQYVRHQAEEAWPGLSVEELKRQLEGIQQIELLYRQEGEKGPGRTVTIASQQTLVQRELSKVLQLEKLFRNDRG